MQASTCTNATTDPTSDKQDTIIEEMLTSERLPIQAQRECHTLMHQTSIQDWHVSKCTSCNDEDMEWCEYCGSVKRSRRTETGISPATQTRTAPTPTLAPVVAPMAPPDPPMLPERAPNTNRPGAKANRHNRVKTKASAAPAEAVASFSMEETNDAMRVSLLVSLLEV